VVPPLRPRRLLPGASGRYPSGHGRPRRSSRPADVTWPSLCQPAAAAGHHSARAAQSGPKGMLVAIPASGHVLPKVEKRPIKGRGKRFSAIDSRAVRQTRAGAGVGRLMAYIPPRCRGRYAVSLIERGPRSRPGSAESADKCRLAPQPGSQPVSNQAAAGVRPGGGRCPTRLGPVSDQAGAGVRPGGGRCPTRLGPVSDQAGPVSDQAGTGVRPGWGRSATRCRPVCDQARAGYRLDPRPRSRGPDRVRDRFGRGPRPGCPHGPRLGLDSVPGGIGLHQVTDRFGEVPPPGRRISGRFDSSARPSRASSPGVSGPVGRFAFWPGFTQSIAARTAPTAMHSCGPLKISRCERYILLVVHLAIR
jgi:hypothetical protein